MEEIGTTIVRWSGPLRGFQKIYLISVLWDHASDERPYVYLLEPRLRPRLDGSFIEIPHLIFNDEAPELSGLCLFDGQEWTNRLLIADTTIPWAAEWLFYYEMWHLDGVWRGGGVGAERISETRPATIY
jgi:hypothetical protein